MTSGARVAVLHLPGVVGHVVGGASEEERQGPRATDHPPGRVRRPQSVKKCRAIRFQALRLEYRLERRATPTFFANWSGSLRMTWRMIWARARPPPRDPGRSSSPMR